MTFIKSIDLPVILSILLGVLVYFCFESSLQVSIIAACGIPVGYLLGFLVRTERARRYFYYTTKNKKDELGTIENIAQTSPDDKDVQKDCEAMKRFISDVCPKK